MPGGTRRPGDGRSRRRPRARAWSGCWRPAPIAWSRSGWIPISCWRGCDGHRAACVA